MTAPAVQEAPAWRLGLAVAVLVVVALLTGYVLAYDAGRSPAPHCIVVVDDEVTKLCPDDYPQV